MGADGSLKSQQSPVTPEATTSALFTLFFNSAQLSEKIIAVLQNPTVSRRENEFEVISNSGTFRFLLFGHRSFPPVSPPMYSAIVFTVVGVVVILAVALRILEKPYLKWSLGRLFKKAQAKKQARTAPSPLKGKTLLFLVNPFGGEGLGQHVFASVVKPLLDEAGIHSKVIVTQHANHPKELAMTLDLAPYAGIVCISGDGMLHQVLNGILQRPEADTMENKMKVLQRTPLGLIPAGTSNGIATSLFGAPDPITATKMIINGRVQTVDLFEIKVGETRTFYDLHIISWAMTADYDELLEVKWRWMVWVGGRLFFSNRQLMRLLSAQPTPIRKAITPLFLIGRCRRYQAKLRFKPLAVPKDEAEKYNYRDSFALPQDPTDPSWRIIPDNNVTFFTAMNLTHAASDVIFAPGILPNDGSVDVLVLKKPSRWELLKVFMQLEAGTQVWEPCVEMYKASEFVRVTPTNTSGSRY
jgi:sphingosine kinase